MVVWSIWRQRNNLLWNNSVSSEAQTVFMARYVLCDWLAAQRDKCVRFTSVVHAARAQRSWNVSPAPFLKCNIDFATFSDQR